MDVDDHYSILGLPSGEEGAKLSGKEISKAYRSKALELHPDKRPDDPSAHANFQRLKSSYEILKDEKTKKLFDDQLQVKREQDRRQSQHDGKRRKMASDLDQREEEEEEEDAFAPSKEEEEELARALEEVMPKEVAKATEARVLKVLWEKVGRQYTAPSLRELFSKFGEVENIVTRRSSALVVMATKEAAVAATGNVSGDLSNPLVVLPLQPQRCEPGGPDRLIYLLAVGFKPLRDAVLQKSGKV